MIVSLLIQHQLGIVIFLSAILAIAASNWRILKRLEREAAEAGKPALMPSVSLLVPARNEAINILPMVRSLLDQDYPTFQVLVLNDQSEDGTGAILAELASREPRLCVMDGRPLPAGWLGKHWACHQLAEAANGELLLFTDADTCHHPQALRDAVAVMLAQDIDLLSALPHQEVLTWGERLIVPLLYWSFMAFIPLGLAYRMRLPALSMAIGQFILIRREAYDRVGGYEAIRRHPADDLAMVRRVKALGLRWKLLDGGGRIRCRMYTNFTEACQGISKNLFAVFDHRILPFIFVWSWLGLVFIGPLVLLAASGLTGLVPPDSTLLASLAVVEGLSLWFLVVKRFHFSLWIALFYPLNILLAVGIAFRAVILSYMGRAIWKGRRLARPGVHWW